MQAQDRPLAPVLSEPGFFCEQTPPLRRIAIRARHWTLFLLHLEILDAAGGDSWSRHPEHPGRSIDHPAIGAGGAGLCPGRAAHFLALVRAGARPGIAVYLVSRRAPGLAGLFLEYVSARLDWRRRLQGRLDRPRANA